MQSSWGQHGAHLGPVGPRWAPCWPHEPCYQGLLASERFVKITLMYTSLMEHRKSTKLTYFDCDIYHYIKKQTFCLISYIHIFWRWAQFSCQNTCLFTNGRKCCYPFVITLLQTPVSTIFVSLFSIVYQMRPHRYGARENGLGSAMYGLLITFEIIKRQLWSIAYALIIVMHLVCIISLINTAGKIFVTSQIICD